eukprot:971362_1
MIGGVRTLKSLYFVHISSAFTMSAKGKYKHFVEVTMIPLNGVLPVLYNFEMALIATILDLKHEIIGLMQKHGEGVKYLLAGYMQQMDVKSTAKYKHAWIIPIDILHLCGKYYDAYYSMAINTSVSNMVITGKDTTFCNDTMQITNIVNSFNFDVIKLTAYELMDDDIVRNYIKRFKTRDEDVALKLEYRAVPIYHKGVEGHILVIKLPQNIIIERGTIIRRLIDKLTPYIKSPADGLNYSCGWDYDIHVGETNVNEMEALCLVLVKRFHVHSMFIIKNGKDRKEIMDFLSNENNKIHNDYIPWSSDEDRFCITWHSDVFKHEMFENPPDTITNHVCAKLQDDQTEAIQLIETMFD